MNPSIFLSFIFSNLILLSAQCIFCFLSDYIKTTSLYHSHCFFFIPLPILHYFIYSFSQPPLIINSFTLFSFLHIALSLLHLLFFSHFKFLFFSPVSLPYFLTHTFCTSIFLFITLHFYLSFFSASIQWLYLLVLSLSYFQYKIYSG